MPYHIKVARTPRSFSGMRCGLRTPLIRWAWLPVIALLVPLAIALRPDGGSAPAGAQQENAMAIDADPSDPDIDDSAVRYTGEPWFEISTDIAAVATPYVGYQMSIEFDDSILSFVSVEPPYGIVYTGLGNMTLNTPSIIQDVDVDTNPEITGSTGRTYGTTTATGQANLVRFQCIAPGGSALHLHTLAEDPGSGSTTQAPGGGIIGTSLADAAITCSDATPVPTLTPTATPTRAAVGGIADLPPFAGASGEEAGTPARGSGWSSGGYAAAAGGLAAAAIVAVGAWYARRRWVR